MGETQETIDGDNLQQLLVTKVKKGAKLD